MGGKMVLRPRSQGCDIRDMICAKEISWIFFLQRALDRLGTVVQENNKVDRLASIVSSVRSSSVYHGLLHTQQATFSNFSNSSDSKGKVKVKGPNMCYIFEKHGIQGYQI